MSTIEEKLLAPKPAARPVSLDRAGEPAVSRFLRFVSSVRFGVALLCLLGLLCLVGMLVMQQNVDGFANYYASLTPAQRLVYGKLGLFNIYHSVYFNVLLCVLSLNIILASIDRFPKTWAFVSKPQVSVPLRWLAGQKQAAEFVLFGSVDELREKVQEQLKLQGWRRTFAAEKNGQTYVYGESGGWNRLGAYPVHIALLTIFLGGFLTAQFGTGGEIPLAPGESTNLINETVANLDNVKQITKRLPFEVAVTDIEQKLIREDGPISAGNTIDWITRFTITDEDQTYEAMVQMNRPFDYRGYRFFQASFTPVGRARSITLDVAPAGEAARQVTIDRDATATLDDGTLVRFAEFRGNFRTGPEDPNEDTSSYPNPAAVLQVTPPGGTVQTAYAFGPQAGNFPAASKPVAGYTFRLSGFEKAADKHVLSLQRDPGANVVYAGFLLLFITLAAVFFFSHQRVWVVIQRISPGEYRITAAGNTNRNQSGFDDKFRRFVSRLSAGQIEEV